MRARDGDPAAKSAMATLGNAMSHPSGELRALEARLTQGDATASSQMLLYEAGIAQAALASGHR